MNELEPPLTMIDRERVGALLATIGRPELGARLMSGQCPSDTLSRLRAALLARPVVRDELTLRYEQQPLTDGEGAAEKALAELAYGRVL